MRARWAPIGLEPQPTTPAEFDKLIAEDIATFTRIAHGRQYQGALTGRRNA